MAIDFQKVVDSMSAMTCVVSVEKLEDGGYGEIRIVTGNKAYIDSIEHPMDGVVMLTQKFEPNMVYTTYLPKDLNFEDYCYRSAVRKKCLHSYAHPDRFDVWFNMTFMPLEPDDGNICYCTYSMEMDFEPDSNRMSNLSGNIASAVLATCIMLQDTANLKKTMNEVVKSIRELCKAQRCCLLLIDHDEKKCEVLGNDCVDKEEEKTIYDYISDGFYEIACTWEDTISGSNCLIAKNAQDMETVKQRNPVWYQSLAESGVKTMVLFPLKNEEKVFGYIWANDFDPDDVPMIKEALESTAFILSSEIYNHLLMNRLRILSSKDMLTGVNNRNEMNNTVDVFVSNTDDNNTVGVVFADLNGLKTVNDIDGHVAGDELLKRAAIALCEVFDSSDIYRAGGDEFTIIISGITEPELIRKAEQVKKISENYEGVSFAIGCGLADKSSDIRVALRVADERMYADKKKYYAEHPEKKIRR